MKVIYHSALKTVELMPGIPLRTAPCKAYIELQKNPNEAPCEMVYNRTLIKNNPERIDCNEEGELVIRQNGDRKVYTVRPLVRPLSKNYAKTYEQFYYEYQGKKGDEISSILDGQLKLYAVDQNADIYDWTGVFDQIEEAFSAFKSICDKPKSHLKAVNEVRPIETVKRIGYESIPYLASHSEDWLARTASGLKPARLFSRVEDDEYQIYENRVVKTLIDQIISFLRKTEKQLRDQREQLRGIMNCEVQTGSFGFDVSFRKAVNELMSSVGESDEYRLKTLELVEKLQIRAYYLLKKYRTLRQSRLYRYLRKSKSVQGPLRETNILVLDKQYGVIFRLWKTIHRVIVPKVLEDDNLIAFDDSCENYQQYCATLCGFAAHVLGFELTDDGQYERKSDHLAVEITSSSDGTIRVQLFDQEPRCMIVSQGLDVPIPPGSSSHRISYDGKKLLWPNDITDSEIDGFCALFKNKSSRGKEQSEEKRKYTALKAAFDQAQRSYTKPGITSFLIIPEAVELDTETRSSFKNFISHIADDICTSISEEDIVIALPLCNEDEQKVIDYAKEDGEKVSIIALSMFDINSFRRIQTLLYRHILELDKGRCLNCGGPLRKQDNHLICDACSKLTITKTRCPNPECKQEYYYLGYDASEDIIQKMSMVSPEEFFQWDSLFQYKNIVNMKVTDGKIRTICPHCHRSQ